jgi:23S rRNA pseudouridine1911/1915/1917 synthase
MVSSFIVEQEMTLLEVLQLIHRGSSNRTLRHMLTQGRVTIDGVGEKRAKTTVSPGSKIEVHPRPVPDVENIRGIIHEDDDIIVISKPAGLLTVATDKMESDTLHSRIQSHLQQDGAGEWGFIVHRLDKETSGIIVFAKTESAKEFLQRQFSERKVKRYYTAIVEGEPEEEGTAASWLIEDRNLRVWVVDEQTKGAREAITHWSVLEKNGTTSKIELEIETGRRHQIRVQMAEMGHPVVGDLRHDSKIQTNRLLLHATTLRFIHPDGNTLTLHSTLPHEFEKQYFLITEDMG